MSPAAPEPYPPDRRSIPRRPEYGQVFSATVDGSATDNATSTVSYNVVSPADLAILKLAPLLVRAGGTITYTIGVGNLGGSNAVGVVVNDTLPADTTLVGSPSGNNVSCAIVNRRLTCTTTPMSCPRGANRDLQPAQTPIAPLSLSSLNGATVKITVKLGSTWTAGKVVKNTANVSRVRTRILSPITTPRPPRRW